jgi:hypothetical protein
VVEEVAVARKRLKLFVWRDVLWDAYPGVMFALAPDVETARAMLLEQGGGPTMRCDLVREPEIYDQEPFALAVWGGS